MPVLTFLCPTTRAYFDSGVRLDERSAVATGLKIVRVRCPECHREHRFLLADGILDPFDSVTDGHVVAAGRQSRGIAFGRDLVPAANRFQLLALVLCSAAFSWGGHKDEQPWQSFDL